MKHYGETSGAVWLPSCTASNTVGMIRRQIVIKAFGSSWQMDFQAKGLSPEGKREVCERYCVLIETISDDIRPCVDLAELKFPIPKSWSQWRIKSFRCGPCHIRKFMKCNTHMKHALYVNQFKTHLELMSTIEVMNWLCKQHHQHVLITRHYGIVVWPILRLEYFCTSWWCQILVNRKIYTHPTLEPKLKLLTSSPNLTMKNPDASCHV